MAIVMRMVMMVLMKDDMIRNMSGLAQEYSHAHVVMVITDMLNTLRRIGLRILMVMIMPTT